MSDFANTIHILGRFPELGQNRELLSWLQKYGGETWHETRPDENGQLTIIIQSKSQLNLFAMLLQRDTSSIEEGIIRHSVLRTASIDLTEQNVSKSAAALLVRGETGVTNEQIHAIRPVVDFASKEPQVSWEIEVNADSQIVSFSVDSSSKLQKKVVAEVKKTEKVRQHDDFVPITNDWLSENDLHHPSQADWRGLAQEWTAGALTTSDKAFRIWLKVRETMLYDEHITHISEFTWSDNLTRHQNGWKGICDEWAVVQITLLRAIGIPAVMKFLIWKTANKSAGHACVEWSDNGTWRHMDALWSAFDNPAVYRQSGNAQNLTVMDADYPVDSRYNGQAWGIPDISGDQKLYPYGDFIISPTYPGNSRPRYSY